MSRFDELCQRELERLQAAELVQPGTEEEVLALHGKVLGLFDRVYFRVDPTAGKTCIRVLPLVCKRIPLSDALLKFLRETVSTPIKEGLFALPWGNIWWEELGESWVLSLHLPGQKVSEFHDVAYPTLGEAVNAARKALNAQLPLTMLRYRLGVPRIDELTSVFPSREEVEAEARWVADYWLSVEGEALRELGELKEELDRGQEQHLLREMYDDLLD